MEMEKLSLNGLWHMEGGGGIPALEKYPVQYIPFYLKTALCLTRIIVITS